MSTIVHIPVKLPPVELGARQCKLPHVRVAASDKSINLLIILICPWHQPPKPPQREFWSSWQQNIQPGSFKATLWKGHREPKSLAPRKSVVGLFQTWGQPSRTLKPRDPFIKMVTSWIILTQIHLVILMVLETHTFCWSIELSFCWIRSSAKASGFASGTSTLRCELGLETDAFLLRLPFEFCRLWQMKRVEQAFLHQKLTLVDKDLTKWTCEL